MKSKTAAEIIYAILCNDRTGFGNPKKSSALSSSRMNKPQIATKIEIIQRRIVVICAPAEFHLNT
jgi:hypothetical protein